MNDIKIGITGASGRMGQAVRAAIEDDSGFSLGASHSRGDALPDFASACDVVVDFSRPELVVALAPACAAAGRPLVCGTTGLDEAARTALADAASSIPVVYAANFSVGVTLLTHLVATVSGALGDDWRCGIFDAHHKHKVDSPSGTALALGAAAGRPVEYACEREGDTVGFHEVAFDGPGERLTLAHEALDRSIFALGALRAARWVAGRAPGFYGMAEVLALKSR